MQPYSEKKQAEFDLFKLCYSGVFEKSCESLGVDPQSVSDEQKEKFFYVQFEHYVQVLKDEDVFVWDY